MPHIGDTESQVTMLYLHNDLHGNFILEDNDLQIYYF